MSAKEKILEVAERLFSMRGYDAVSMQHIASEAAISKASIYHHFRSKDDLYLAVLHAAIEAMHPLLDDLQNLNGSPSEQLACFSAKHLQYIHDKSSISKLILREMLDGDHERGQALADRVFRDYFNRLRLLLCKAQASGSIRSDIDADHMAIALAGLNVFLFQAWPVLRQLSTASFQDQAVSGQLMFDLLFHGIANKTHTINEE